MDDSSIFVSHRNLVMTTVSTVVEMSPDGGPYGYFHTYPTFVFDPIIFFAPLF